MIAGAGSGKTRTPTYRVAYLLENGVDPRNILLSCQYERLFEIQQFQIELLEELGNKNREKPAR